MPQRHATPRRMGRLAIATLLALAATLLFAPPSDAVVRPMPAYCLSAITTAPFANATFGIAVDQVDGRVFVAQKNPPAVTMLDPVTHAVLDTFPFSAGADLGDIVVDHAAGRFYVAAFGPNKVYGVDIAGGFGTGNWDVTAPQGLALDAARKKLYVGSSYLTEITVADLATSGSKTSIDIGGTSVTPALNTGGTLLFVGDYTHGTIDVVDTATKAVLHEWDLPGAADNSPMVAAWDDTSGHVWVATRNPGRVEEVDPATGALGVSFAFPNAQGFALNAAAGVGFVSPFTGNPARAFRLSDGVIIKSFTVAEGARAIAVRANPLRAYVTALGTPGDVTVFGAGGGPFTDVVGANPFCGDITWMVALGITTGYEGGLFKPTQSVTRQSIAAFLYRLAGSPAYSPPPVPSFKDVPKDHAFYKHIEWLVSKGIATGYGDDTFRPAVPVSRQAVASFLYKYLAPASYTPPPTATFTDVPISHTFRKQIEHLAQLKVINGYADHTFHPADPVSRQAIAAFLHRLPAS